MQSLVSCQLLHYPHSVGVLGGGFHSVPTLQFLKRLREATAAEGDLLRIPLVLCGDPNASHHLGALIQQREFLEDAGAKCIALPCPSSLRWFTCLDSGSSAKLLNVVDSLVEELHRAELRPLQGAARPRIGILTCQGLEFYQEKLEQEGFEVVLPDKASKDRLIVPAMAALERRDFQGHRSLIRVAIHMLLVNAVNRVMGDDLTAALFADDPLLLQCIDPANSLAKATVTWVKQQIQTHDIKCRGRRACDL
ncbi:uncharacterized protein LOC112340765 [Selaginella moellendorffii]|uniref:uncharacterized protein LOC112340765 n=1 Tax=Selaginella moellendorffii TaxID=88036 RepID=UPI000D1CCB87|nr:uncharacterized protein LOC112340765 [Selaginella moellendorffii]|eukprot:XP_024515502.1 uncharacterized protein LOC112340765 [Selaginella moellendorffii]